MGEFDLIEKYFKRDNSYPGVSLAIGDDCAIVDIPEGKQLVFSIDTLLPDVHFFSNADPSDIARRAFCVALSDIAAMGASPLGFTLALTLPELDENWLQGFSDGLHSVAVEYQCPLIGGDTVKGPLTISLQMHGVVDKHRALQRSGAQVGDVIFVSGSLGDGAAALHVLDNSVSVDAPTKQYFNKRYFMPEPQVTLGKSLLGMATACIDISDGFLADLGHICRSSRVGAEIDISAIPMSKALKLLSNQDELAWALCGGDDYQLCFTVPESQVAAVESVMASTGVSLTHVGRIVPGESIRSNDGALLKVNGYQHF